MGNLAQTRETSRNAGALNKSLNETRKRYADQLNAKYKSAAATTGSDSRENFQTYPYDYYCGTQSKVFFGDIWVDDIVTINYHVKQDKEPIYGYASQNFDAVARGVILVQGSFTIAFKEMGYLNIIQGLLETQRAKASEASTYNAIDKKSQQAFVGEARIDPSLIRTVGEQTSMTYSPTGNPQIIRQQETVEGILKYKKHGNIVSSGLAVNGQSLGSDKDFEDFAEMLEDTIWGDANGKPYDPNKTRYRRADEFDYTWSGSEDIGGIIVGKDNNYAKVLNIMITFGDINDYRAEHTMVVLNDVHIVSTSMIVAPTGEPIGETYHFFARDINKSLSKETLRTLDPIIYNIGGSEFSAKDMNVKAIEDYLNKVDQIVQLKFMSVAHFNDEKGVWESDNTIAYGVGGDQYGLSFKSYESKLDQMIQQVERIINSTDGVQGYDQAEITRYSQWMFDVALIDNNRAYSDTSGNDYVQQFKMVLEQQIPNTLTFKVISPTRQNYSSNASFTRDDMWIPQPPVNTGEEIPPAATTKPPVDAASQIPPAPTPPVDQSEAAVAKATEQAMKTAGVETKTPEAKKAISQQAKQDAAKYNYSNFSVLGPQNVAYQTQGAGGPYSHNSTSKSQVDISPVTAGPNAGLVYAPLSAGSTITYGKSTVNVQNPDGYSYSLSHMEIDPASVGTSVKLDMPGVSQAGGVYFTPLRTDPSSKKFTGPHGHFQTDAPTQSSQEGFRQWLQQSYTKNNVEYRVLK